MSLAPRQDGGYYDENGEWQQIKHCFVYCGPERCTCQPPGGQHYSPLHDKKLQNPEDGKA